MNKTNIVASLLMIAVLFSLSASPIEAAFWDNARERFNNAMDKSEERRDNRQENRDDRKEKISSKAAEVRLKLGVRVAFGNAKLTSVNGTTLTVEKDSKSYTVLTGEFEKCTTKFKRRFWGNSGLSEYTIGDLLNISGRYQDEAKTIIEACVIRDISIQKRFGVFVGQVVSLASSGWVMTTTSDKRVNQTVTVKSDTKFVNRREQAIAQGDIQVGHKVRVKGLWNRTNNTVTEVTHVKDYSLPVVPTVAVTATVTAGVTSTPTPTPTP